MKLQETTLDDVNGIVDFITGLVFKDTLKADALETQESAANASRYLSAYLGNDDNSQVERQVIITNYVERNPYYAELFTQHEIPYHASRLARDLDIIKQPAFVASVTPHLAYYRSIYGTCLTAFYATSYSKAMENKENYREVVLMAINLMAFLNLCAKWLENPFDIDLMNDTQVNKFMASFGIPFFNEMPSVFKRRIAKNLNRLISAKGTDQVVVDILDIFDFKNINIFKYYLGRSVANSAGASEDPTASNYLTSLSKSMQFISHNIRIPSLSTAIKTNKYRKTAFDSFVTLDPTWAAPKEEVSQVDFDYVQTKFFSIETGFDLSAESISTIFILNLIKRIRRTYPQKEFMKITARSISNTDVAIEDVILTLQVLTNEYHGIVDTIDYSATAMGSVYEFARIDNALMNTELFAGSGLAADFYTLTNMNSVGVYDKNAVNAIAEQNLKVHENMKDLMRSETDYQRYKKLRDAYNFKFIQKLNYDLFGGVPTYSDYLETAAPSLHAIIANVRELRDANPELFRTTMNNRITELTDIVSEYLSNFSVILGTSSLSIIAQYLFKVVNTFKSFTVSLRDLDIYVIAREDYLHRLMDWASFTSELSIKEAIDINNFKYKLLATLHLRDNKINYIDTFGDFVSTLKNKDSTLNSTDAVPTKFSTLNVHSMPILSDSMRYSSITYDMSQDFLRSNDFAVVWTIAHLLFASDEQGAWYDPSDMRTLFQDAAFTVPVTAVEQQVGGMLDKSGRGNHAFMATATKRPVYSRRVNTLLNTENPSAWEPSGVTGTAEAGGVSLLQSTTDGSNSYPSSFYPIGYTDISNSCVYRSFEYLPGDALYVSYGPAAGNNLVTVRTSDGVVVGDITGGAVLRKITPLVDGWVRLETWHSSESHGASQISNILTFGNTFTYPYIAAAGQADTQIRVRRPQYVVLPFGSTHSVEYQRVTTATDYDADPTKFPAYLRFDGVDDALQTESIDFTGTDKMTVWAGVLAEPNGPYGFIAELSPTSDFTSGTFSLYAPHVWGNITAVVNGTSAVSYQVPSTFPGNYVISSSNNLAGETRSTSLALRINSVGYPEYPGVGASAGGGVFSNYPLYIGARAGIDHYFKGHLYSLIIRGAQSSLSQIEATEAYIKQAMNLP